MPSLPQHTSHEHSTPDNLPELTAAQADYLEIIYEEQLKTGNQLSFRFAGLPEAGVVIRNLRIVTPR